VAVQRLLNIGEGALQVVGFAIGVVFVLLLIGGSVYKTECIRPEGLHTHGWELAESWPYLTGAHPGCVNHTLTRYVLGKVGVMSDVDR
jgi:hypothetical protein